MVAVARDDSRLEISEQSLEEVRRTRAVIEALADDTQPHYGVSTGFGALATRHIPVELRAQLQRSLVRSHAAGSGAEVEREVVRALMLLRISTLATGRTGVREETLRAYAGMLDDLARCADAMAVELSAGRAATAVRTSLVALGKETSRLERSSDLSAEVILAQARSLVADLLAVSGMDPLAATDQIPPLTP